MKSLKRIIRDYFGFPKSQINGFLILLPLTLLTLFSPAIYLRLTRTEYTEFNSDKKLLDSLLLAWNENFVEKENFKPASNEVKPFVFNPNSASIEEFKELGLPSFLAERIEKYRQAGGSFKVKSDFAKIYGLTDQQYADLEDFIDLPEKILKQKSDRPAARKVEKKEVERGLEPLEIEEEEFFVLDINSADTTQWKKLKGIGSGFSNRIVNYRRALGGFVSIGQLAEVYHLNDTLFQSIKPHLSISDSVEVQQINLNVNTFKEINAHPYISFEQTKEIMNAKSKYGKFDNAWDLLKITLFDSAQIIKLKPYLRFQ